MYVKINPREIVLIKKSKLFFILRYAINSDQLLISISDEFFIVGQSDIDYFIIKKLIYNYHFATVLLYLLNGYNEEEDAILYFSAFKVFFINSY